MAEKGNWYKKQTSKSEQEGGEDNRGSVGPKPDVQSWSLGPDGDQKVDRRGDAKQHHANVPLAVMFLPRTTNGELVRRLRRKEQE